MDPILIEYLKKKQGLDAQGDLSDSLTKAGSQLGAAIAGAKAPDMSAVDQAAKVRDSRSQKIQDYFEKQQAAKDKAGADAAAKAEQMGVARERLAETMRHNQALEQASKENRGITGLLMGLREMEAKGRMGEREQRNIDRLDKDLSGVNDMSQNLAVVKSTLENPKTNTGELWNSKAGELVNKVGSWAGNESATLGNNFTAAYNAVGSAILKNRSGLNVTAQEYERFKKSMAEGATKEQIIDAWNRVINSYNAEMNDAYARHGKNVDKWKEEGRITDYRGTIKTINKPGEVQKTPRQLEIEKLKAELGE
jgi:hypothetical protein